MKSFCYYLDMPSSEEIARQYDTIGAQDGGDIAEYRALGFHDVAGVDTSSVMVEAAHKRLDENTSVKAASWTQLPYPDTSKDIVIGRSALHYVDNLDMAYGEAARVLRPGGMLIIVSPHPDKVNRVVTQEGQEYVQNSIFDGAVTITYPRHSMDDYLSPFFLNLFEVEIQTEFKRVTPDGKQEPGQIAFTARLRINPLVQ